MEIAIQTPRTRELRITTDLDELAELHGALTAKKRTRKQTAAVHRLAAALVSGDPDLRSIVEGGSDDRA